MKLISSVEVFNNTPYGKSKKEMEKIAQKYSAACIRLPTIWGSKKSLFDQWLNCSNKGEDIELFLFEKKTKKKFFMTIEEAAEFCVNAEWHKTQWPKCRVFDSGILAEVFADLFGVGIKKIEKKGNHFELMDKDCCSSDFDSLSYEETKFAINKIINYS